MSTEGCTSLCVYVYAWGENPALEARAGEGNDLLHACVFSLFID